MNAPRRFRKKPVEIVARRIPVWGQPNNFGSDRPSEENPLFCVSKFVDECVDIAEWCGGTNHMMCTDDEVAFNGALCRGPHIEIPTLEGNMAARPGDWIIRGVKGEFYPCRPDIFETTYEAVQ